MLALAWQILDERYSARGAVLLIRSVRMAAAVEPEALPVTVTRAKCVVPADDGI